MDHISFLYSSVDGHLGCLHLLTVVTSVAVDTGVRTFTWTCVFVSLGNKGHCVDLSEELPASSHTATPSPLQQQSVSVTVILICRFLPFLIYFLLSDNTQKSVHVVSVQLVIFRTADTPMSPAPRLIKNRNITTALKVPHVPPSPPTPRVPTPSGNHHPESKAIGLRCLGLHLARGIPQWRPGSHTSCFEVLLCCVCPYLVYFFSLLCSIPSCGCTLMYLCILLSKGAVNIPERVSWSTSTPFLIGGNYGGGGGPRPGAMPGRY